ncbi:MAG: YihY/virulence factor BrkB family protein [Bacteroidia bacterium]
MVAQLNKIKHFFETDIWEVKSDLAKPIKFLRQALRVLIISGKGYIENKSALKGSALTFYTILSVVPVLAVAFGVAQGFGLEDKLESQIRVSFAGQEEVMTKIIEFSRKSLHNVQGGLVAGISVLFLLWSVIKLLNHIENAFNAIWNLEKSRTFIRKFTDYLTLILIGPVFIIISGSATVFINTQLESYKSEGMFFEYTSSFFLSAMQLAPFVLIWVFFTILYMIIPNKNVKFLPALVGGILAGTAFAFLQNGYVYFQLAMSRYNAIYGSFAALPLFLIWLQISWMFILFGAEVSHAVQYAEKLIYVQQGKNISQRLTKMLCVNVLKEIAEKFEAGERAHSLSSLSERLNIPIHFTEKAIELLLNANLISEVNIDQNVKQKGYQPYSSVNILTFTYVVQKLESAGANELNLPKGSSLDHMKEVFAHFEEEQNSLNFNKPITQL